MKARECYLLLDGECFKVGDGAILLFENNELKVSMTSDQESKGRAALHSLHAEQTLGVIIETLTLTQDRVSNLRENFMRSFKK